MRRNWVIIEKIIGSLLAIWGIIALYNITTVVLESINHGHIPPPNLSYVHVVKITHLNFLLALTTMFAGILILPGDKEGWLLSIVCTAMYAITFLISAKFNSRAITQPYFQFFKSYFFMALLFIAVTILLLQKPFREKYRPTTRNWNWVFVVLLVLIIDKIIF